MIFRRLRAPRPLARFCFITHQKGRMLRAPRAPARSRRSAQLRGVRITGGTSSEQMSQMRRKGREAASRPRELGAARLSAAPASTARAARLADVKAWLAVASSSPGALAPGPLLSSKEQGGGRGRCPGLPTAHPDPAPGSKRTQPWEASQSRKPGPHSAKEAVWGRRREFHKSDSLRSESELGGAPQGARGPATTPFCPNEILHGFSTYKRGWGGRCFVSQKRNAS